MKQSTLIIVAIAAIAALMVIGGISAGSGCP